MGALDTIFIQASMEMANTPRHGQGKLHFAIAIAAKLAIFAICFFPNAHKASFHVAARRVESRLGFYWARPDKCSHHSSDER